MYDLPYQLSVFLFHLTPLTFLFVGLVVWQSRNKEQYHVCWTTFCLLTTVAWTHAVVLTFHMQDPVWAKQVGRVAILFGCLSASMYYTFVLSYLNLREQLRKRWLVMMSVGGLLALGFLFTDMLYAGVTKGARGIFQPKPGPLMALYLPFVLFSFGSGLYHSRQAYRRSSGQKRLPLRYFYYASWVVMCAALGSLVPYSGGKSSWVWVPSALTVSYPILVSYVIIRHRLWDIRTVLHKTALWFLVSVLTLAPVYFLIDVLLPFVQNQPTFLAFFTVILYGVILFIVYNVQPKIDEMFARRRFEQRQVIDDFIEEIRHLQHIEPLTESLHSTLRNKLKASSSRLLLMDKNNCKLLDTEDPTNKPIQFEPAIHEKAEGNEATESNEEETGSITRLPHWSHAWILERDQSIDSTALKTSDLADSQHQDLLQAMTQRQVEVWLPLLHNNRLIGLLELGEKNNYQAYTLEDFQMFERIRSAIEVAVSNAQLYKELQVTNQELQLTTEELRALTSRLDERVKQRTADLATAKQEIEGAYQKLQQANEARTRFFTNITHELRTPLTLILAPLEDLLLLEDDKLPPDLPPTLQLMRRQAIHLYSLINDLLDLAQIDAKQLRLRIREFSLQERLSSIISGFVSLAKRKEIQFEVEIDDDLPTLMADPDKLERVFINLLGNAIKFTPRKGKVSLRFHLEDDWIVGEVEDNGIGIPVDQQDRIFDRFAQVQDGDDRPYEGTGIGLSLVKELVHYHGGNIEVESEPDEGALFRVRLPLQQGHVDQDMLDRREAHIPTEHTRRSSDANPLHSFQVRPAVAAGHSVTARTAPDVQPQTPLVLSDSSDSLESLPTVGSRDLLPSSKSSTSLKKHHSGVSYPSIAESPSHPELLLAESIGESRTMLRIQPDAPFRPKSQLLVVEDNPDMQRYLSSILAPHYDIILSNNGREALEQLDEVHPDLILSDVMMPEVSGYDLCRHVKQNKATSSIPVILLTAKKGNQPTMQGFQVGADDYVVKPFHSKELLARIQVHLRLQQMAQQLALQEKVSLMGLLAAGLAHEVRNPANAAYHSVKPIRRMVESNDPTLHKDIDLLLDVIAESVGRITTLSDNLLGLAGNSAEGLGSWEVPEAFQITSSLLSHQYPQVHEVQTSFQHTSSMIGVPSQLNQLLLNLLSNALRATEEEGIVALETHTQDERFILTIRDTGCGISPEVLPHIFDPLYTTLDVGQGTGLGLYLVRNITQNHKGEITVQSRLKEGTTITVNFPLESEARMDLSASFSHTFSSYLPEQV